jgi:hypothetical protein
VVLAVGALFTGIGEGAVNRLMDMVSPQESAAAPAPRASTSPALAKEPLTIALRTDIGEAPDEVALKNKESDGTVAATLVSGKIGTWDTFLSKQNGAPVENLVVSMVLTGHRDTGIRIVNIGVEKLGDDSVLDGTFINIRSQGEAKSIELTANLDEAQPRILSEGAPYFPKTTIQLKNGEQDSVVVILKASNRLYRWVFAIDYVDENGAAQRVFINRLGNTFAKASDSPLADAFMLTGKAPKYGASWISNLGEGGFSPLS